MSRIREALDRWLDDGIRRIGQVVIRPEADGGFTLRHADDDPGADAERFEGAASARLIAADDDHGNYRPLKTAPTLRHGWSLRVADRDELRRALDFLYPGALALAAAWQGGGIEATPLRETFGRQSGMYRLVARIEDALADELVGRVCREASCLRRILWEIAPGRPVESLPSADNGREACDRDIGRGRIPLICREACNILVAEARRAMKERRTESAPSGEDH